MIGPLYEAALVEGGVLELEHRPVPGTGPRRREVVPVERWLRAVPGDAALLERCVPPVLDIGSGPGRLTVALAARGCMALGIDVAGPAVAMTRRAGAAALLRDVFGPVPGEGRWRTALLADGNIGIGGDPVALLRRVAELLHPDGHALVELEPPGRAARRSRVRLRRGDRYGDWFDWAYAGIDDIPSLAAHAALDVTGTWTSAGRWFARLARATPGAEPPSAERKAPRAVREAPGAEAPGAEAPGAVREGAVRDAPGAVRRRAAWEGAARVAPSAVREASCG